MIIIIHTAHQYSVHLIITHTRAHAKELPPVLITAWWSDSTAICRTQLYSGVCKYLKACE